MSHSLRIYEQADVTEGFPTRYSWIFDAPYTMRKRLLGWKWVRGYPTGSFVTEDCLLAKNVSNIIGRAIETNGSHAVHNVPMHV